MTDLLGDTPLRPTRLTPEMAERAATRIVDNLIKEKHIEENQRADAIRDIARHGARYPHSDGYGLAKMLDEREGWDCNLDIAETLDGWSAACSEVIVQAQREWVAQHNIQPPLPVGSRVIARWGREDHPGTIDEVYAYGIAQYCVKRDGETTTSRMVVNFEDVRAMEEKVDG